MLWSTTSRTIATHRVPIATHRDPSRPIATHRDPIASVTRHHAITSQSQQPIIHVILSTYAHAFFHLFFILQTHQTREIKHKYSHHIWCHYLLKNHPCYHIASVTRHRATHRISHATPRNPNAISHATPRHRDTSHQSRDTSHQSHDTSHQSHDTSHQSRVSPASCTHL